MATRTSPEQRIIAAATSAMEKTGWSKLNLTDLAKKAKIPLESLYEICPSKPALLALIGKEVDLRFLKSFQTPDEDMPARDRAFDAILGWFEQLQSVKPLLSSIRQDSKGDFSLIVDLAPITLRSAHWIAEAAHLPNTGWQGFLFVRGIGLLLADTINVWIADDKDLAKTMAHIDRRLRMIEGWSETLNKARRDAENSDEK